MVAFIARLDDENARELDPLASRLDRSRSWGGLAIDDDLVREEWQIAEIEAGLAEADRGEFAAADVTHRDLQSANAKLEVATCEMVFAKISGFVEMQPVRAVSERR